MFFPMIIILKSIANPHLNWTRCTQYKSFTRNLFSPSSSRYLCIQLTISSFLMTHIWISISSLPTIISNWLIIHCLVNTSVSYRFNSCAIWLPLVNHLYRFADNKKYIYSVYVCVYIFFVETFSFNKSICVNGVGCDGKTWISNSLATPLTHSNPVHESLYFCFLFFTSLREFIYLSTAERVWGLLVK